MVYLIYIYIYITIVLFRYLKKKIEDTKRISEVVNRRGTDTTMASQIGQQNKQLSTKTLHKKLTIEQHIATKNSRWTHVLRKDYVYFNLRGWQYGKADAETNTTYMLTAVEILYTEEIKQLYIHS